MKRYVKLLIVCVAILLMSVLVLGCGGGTKTESQVGEGQVSETETQGETKHEHVSSQGTIEVVQSTCSVEGYEQYRCDECHARYMNALPLGKHKYERKFDPTTGYEVIKCDGCGDWRMEIDEAGEYAFAATCKGEISFSFEVIGGNAEMDFTVDGNTVKSESYAPGKHTVTVVEGLVKGGHTFGFTLKNTGIALDLTKVEVDGALYRPNAIILELTQAPADKAYSDFFVYVQTSDPSGDYYVRYKFYYAYSTVTTNATNSATNVDAFRVSAADLVKVSAVTDTSVTYTALYDLLSSGEISLAIKEYEYDPAQGKNAVADFCGGFHGDEHIVVVGDEKQLFLEADGVSYIPGAEKKVIKCSNVIFDQTTLLDRWAAVAGSAGQFAKHTQFFEINSLGMSIDRTVEWLVDDFIIDNAYPMMYTLLRIDDSKAICEIVSTYDADGKLLGTETLELHNTDKQKTVLQSAALRRVEYSSATSGISSTASFALGENNDGVLGSPYVAYRTDTVGADNKLYIPMKGTNAITVVANTESGQATKSRPSLGDVWEISCFYHIDYVNPAN